MLYVAEIEIPDRLADGNDFTFGDVFEKTIVLPAKVRKIKSFCCFAELDPCTKMTHLEYTDENDNTTVKDILSAQLGSLSICMNKTDVIVANSPIYSCENLHDCSFNGNKVEFDNPISVTSGTSVKFTVEEKEETPIATSGLYYSYNQPRRNKYTVKIYLEYDK